MGEWVRGVKKGVIKILPMPEIFMKNIKFHGIVSSRAPVRKLKILCGIIFRIVCSVMWECENRENSGNFRGRVRL